MERLAQQVLLRILRSVSIASNVPTSDSHFCFAFKSFHCSPWLFVVHFSVVNANFYALSSVLRTAISQDGRLTTNAFMAEYNQDRFELEIQAKETQPPERTTTAKVLVS